MKKFFYFLCCCTWLGWIAPVYADANNPVNILQNIADQMIASLKSNKTSLKSNPALVYALANKIVVPYADLEEMSKRVLPPQVWNKATSSQRALFRKEFTTLLVRTYASALADYTDQSIQFNPIRGGYNGKQVVEVNSQIIRSDGPAVTVNYKLIKKGAQWKLYDMTVEGVSLLESYRSQFSEKLAAGNIDNLTQELSRHNSGQ